MHPVHKQITRIPDADIRQVARDLAERLWELDELRVTKDGPFLYWAGNGESVVAGDE